jgi:predicted RNase H-like HicB family nuclease/predicted RNA binding protein YcfA (HicA-like mRNA interferase family)
MSKWSKFWDKLSSRQSDNNIDCAELIAYLERLGWDTESAKTSHRFYKHPLVAVPVNIQPRHDGKAKAYTQEKTKMDGYEVKIYYSADDESYVAQIMEFIGCAVDGPTPEIALARLHEAKADWIRIVQEKGLPLPVPRYGAAPMETAMAA